MIYLDTDGTIINIDGNVRPYVREFIRRYMGNITLWSMDVDNHHYAKPFFIPFLEKTHYLIKAGDVVIDDDVNLVLMAEDFGALGIKVPFYHDDDTVFKDIIPKVDDWMKGLQ